MIKLQINRDGMCGKWEDGYELGIRLRWGIYAHGEYERIALSGGKDGNNFDFVMRWCVDAIDGGGERNTYCESCRLPMADYRSRDSYMPSLSESLHKIMIRAGRVDGDVESFLLKAFGPFFDALEHRFDDMVTNISLVTQVFEQPIYIPEMVYRDMEKDLEWSPKGKKKEGSGEK
jgi:hypothetical protein